MNSKLPRNEIHVIRIFNVRSLGTNAWARRFSAGSGTEGF